MKQKKIDVITYYKKNRCKKNEVRSLELRKIKFKPTLLYCILTKSKMMECHFSFNVYVSLK